MKSSNTTQLTGKVSVSAKMSNNCQTQLIIFGKETKRKNYIQYLSIVPPDNYFIPPKIAKKLRKK